MSRNIGQQNHHVQQNAVHAQLDNEIADVRSCIGSSAQETKNLKEQLKDYQIRRNVTITLSQIELTIFPFQ